MTQPITIHYFEGCDTNETSEHNWRIKLMGVDIGHACMKNGKIVEHISSNITKAIILDIVEKQALIDLEKQAT